MHADALPPHASRQGEGDWGRPVLLALLVHLLVLAVFTAAWLWSPERATEAAAGDPSLDASVDVSAADAQVARQALRAEAQPFTPPPAAEPTPLPEPTPEDTVPPPQPIAEPKPQDAPTERQAQAQERIVQPDKVDQEKVSADAESQETAKKEQEAKQRQEQIDLTERKRQEQAEQQRRLAQQQQEEADKKKAAEQKAQAEAQAQAERDKKLAELRKKREQIEAQLARDSKQADLAQQKLRQLAAANAQSGATAAANAPASPGAGGTSNDLSAKYAAAIQQAVLAQWIRPDSVPQGQKCTIHIRQVPGGTVIQAQVSANCPFDDAGRRSIEAAVLRAQPLPYRGFESVFARDLNFNFTAQDR